MHNNFMKKRVIRIFLYIISFILIAVVSVLSIYLIFYFSKNNVAYDSNKIFEPNLSINFYDKDNRLIREDNNFNTAHIRLETLPNYVPEAFISIEDKNFYQHNGLNYKRMIKAFLTNLKSMKIKEGASTISQQLVKNTHLSNERSFKRKFNEILITRKMENQISKDEILESYLNIIYFGNGCYGIENASNYYFSKSARELSLAESATLAGMIKSPLYYSPISNKDNCFERRNLVLREMFKDGKISYNELNNSVIQPINLKINKTKVNKINSYTEAALDEAIEILKMPAKQIAIAGYNIYTYKNTDKQSALEESIMKQNLSCDYASVSINTKNLGVEAYCANSAYKIKDNPRQPGSTLKPIVVYAPALEECAIYPNTMINDEPIDISGYKPTNVSNKYYGYVSVSDSVSKSLNIPAVKCLSYIGISKGKSYAEKCGIEFDENDIGYSVALGGLTNGVNVINIANSYIPFVNSGNYSNAKFINYITDRNGKIIYINKPQISKVFRDDTAYLMTEMLHNATKNGTSKILNDCDFMVASKTGTVGLKNGKGNQDAWNVSYTTDDINATWLGNMDNSPIEHTGSSTLKITKDYFDKIYNSKKPKDFCVPSSIQEIEIDSIEYKENHQIVKANDFTPERYKFKANFSKFNLPKVESKNFISVEPAYITGRISDGKAIITFNADNYLTYEVYKSNNNKTSLIEIVAMKEGEVEIIDSLKENSVNSYYVVTKIKNFTNNTEIASEKSNIVELINTTNGSIINHDKKNSNKWYI